MLNLTDSCLRLIHIQHRLVYKVHETKHTIEIVRIWTHYE